MGMMEGKHGGCRNPLGEAHRPSNRSCVFAREGVMYTMINVVGRNIERGWEEERIGDVADERA